MLITIGNPLVLIANTVLSNVILGDLASLPFVSTNLDVVEVITKRDSDSNSSETAPETHIVSILIEVVVVFAIIVAGELALLLQQCDIILFE